MLNILISSLDWSSKRLLSAQVHTGRSWNKLNSTISYLHSNPESKGGQNG